MDKGHELKANELAREVALHRERRHDVGKKLHWPVEIRRLAVLLLDEGMSTGRLSRASGISRETLRIWRRKSIGKIGCPAGFSELRVVAVADNRPCDSQHPFTNEMALRGLRGNLVTGLKINHIAALLQAGLL